MVNNNQLRCRRDTSEKENILTFTRSDELKFFPKLIGHMTKIRKFSNS